jgi:phage shock protein A
MSPSLGTAGRYHATETSAILRTQEQEPMSDTANEIERLILELQERAKEATQELVRYKANEKQLAAQVTAHEARAAEWEQKAMASVKAGDDALAKQALVERDREKVEAQKVNRDRQEMAHYASGLLKARREFQRKLGGLQLKKGTLAAQLAVARSGGENDPLRAGKAFEELQRLEDKLEDQAAFDELDELVLKEQGVDEVRLKEQMKRAAVEDDLKALKDKMQRK